MWKLKTTLLELIVFCCNYSKAQTTGTDFFHPDSLRSIVETLASDSMEGRLTRSEGCDKAAMFIANEFAKAGLKPMVGNNGFFQSGSFGKNIVGGIQGKSKPDELIIFSAHYDHIGTIKTNRTGFVAEKTRTRKKDSIYNGANDDASGVSAVISLAKYFVTQAGNQRTILFIAFSGEELGLLGSQDFADGITQPELVKAVVNIEMIGRKSSNSDSPYMTGSELSNLFEIMNNRLYKSDPKTYKKSFIDRDYFAKEHLFERSDNYSFARYGIPAHTVMLSSPTDKYYHSLSDEPSTLDYKSMSKIVNAIAIASSGLIIGEDTPSRITNQ